MFASNEDQQFDRWMETASEKADATEMEKPSDVIFAEKRQELDEIFAKAFPQLYLDHPVNRA